MSRSLPFTYTVESGKAITKPGYLIEIGFTAPESPLRLSTRGEVTYNGVLFIGWGFDTSLTQNGTNGSTTGQVMIDNTDNTIGTLVLSQGVADKQIKVWSFYGDAAVLGDPYDLPTHEAFLEFVGVGDDANIDPSRNKVTITLQPESAQTAYGPRTYVTPANGFNVAPTAGQIIHWGGEIYTLDSER